MERLPACGIFVGPFFSLMFAVVVLVLAGQSSAMPGDRESQGLVRPRLAPQVVTVGGAEADITGYTSRAIQIAVDALARRGGGTVKLMPGTFQVAGPVRLASNIALEGSGESTVLRKVDGFQTRFILDADYGMLVVTVEDPSRFEPGTGIEVHDDDALRNCWLVSTAVVTAVEGHKVYFDNYLAKDYQSERNGVVSNACSVVEAVSAENVRIANLVVDGNGETNAPINGCRAGGVYLHKTKNAVVENVTVKDFNGDGFSWQITEDVTVRGCEVYGCGNYGMHPGTGSDRTVVEKCRIHDNASDGLFLCWRVQHGRFSGNEIWGNGRFGVSIGHKDTDNHFDGNHIYGNGHHGVFFRNEDEENAGNRNAFRNNVIEDNGTSEPSYGFYVRGYTRDVVIEGNTIRDSGKGRQIGGVSIGEKAAGIRLEANRFSGLKEEVTHRRNQD